MPAILEMRDSLRHRGPDDAGLYLSPDRRVALGHRRLSILDLSPSGHQPMTNEGRDVWCTFNGEIYNYLLLRKQLEAVGHVFVSSSDTETLLHGYEQWGPKVVSHLRGIFAFAIWDERRGHLLLARDHFGVKPLYYAMTSDGILFASELRAILKHPRSHRKIRNEAVADYLVYGYVPGTRTIFEGVHKLAPGHFLIWGHGTASTSQYWQLELLEAPGDADELAHSIGEMICRSVEMQQAASDVDVGCFLSGGIDSSTIATYAAGSGRGGLQTFTLGFDERSHDESENARSVANHLKTRHFESFATASLAADILPVIAETYDEPFFDTSSISTHEVSRLASLHVKVVLSGDGGDELFGGYDWYSQFLRASRVHGSWPVRRIEPITERLIQSTRGVFGLSRLRTLAPYFDDDPAARYFRLRCLFDTWDLKHALGPQMRPTLKHYEPDWLIREHYRRDWPPLAAVQYVDAMTYLPDDILVKVDRASMQHSLESRVPLLDHELAQLAFSRAAFVDSLERKWLMKKSIGDDLPPGVLDRPKRGFSSPVRAWLRGPLSHLVHDWFTTGRLVEEGFIASDYVDTIHRIKAPGRWNRTWQLLELEAWFRRWVN